MYHQPMNRIARLTRRQLVATGLVAGVSIWGTRLSAQEFSEPWSPEDGLRLAGPPEGISSLDPALSRDLQTNFLVRQCFRGLVGYDDALTPVPELARTIDVSDDQRVYTFALRDDAHFHDGREIEAEDVQFSLSRALSPDTSRGDVTALAGTTYLGDIVGSEDLLMGEVDVLAGVEAVDDRTVRISLATSSTTFLMKLASAPASIVDRYQDFSKVDWWRRLNGSGPYAVAPEPGDEVLHLRAMESWKSVSIPVKDVMIRIGPTAGNPVNLFQNGEIDLVAEIPPAQVSLMEDAATGLEGSFIVDGPQFALSYIAFGNQHAPLDDVHVRRALQHIFPAAHFAEAAFDGRVLPAEGIIPPGMLGQEWPVELPAIDVESARRELAQSRYGDGSSVPPIRVYAADIAPVEALRDIALSGLGLRVEAIQVGWFDFLNGLASRKWDAYSLYWGADYPDPEALLWVLFGSDSRENYTGYMNTEIDVLLDLARQQPDENKRQEIYADVQQRLIDDAAVIPVYVPIQYVAAREGMTHIPLTPMGIIGLERLS